MCGAITCLDRLSYCTLCYRVRWVVHFWLCLRYSLTFVCFYDFSNRCRSCSDSCYGFFFILFYPCVHVNKCPIDAYVLVFKVIVLTLNGQWRWWRTCHMTRIHSLVRRNYTPIAFIFCTTERTLEIKCIWMILVKYCTWSF